MRYIIIIILLCSVGYFLFTKSAPVPVAEPTVSGDDISSISSMKSVNLGEQFTLRKSEKTGVGDEGLEIEVAAFYNDPCPAEVMCFWSGTGVELRYTLAGRAEQGINLLQAFGYETMIVETDYVSYATLTVKRME